MRAVSQVVRPGLNRESGGHFVAVLVFVAAASLCSWAQIYGGPHTTTTVGGHFLAPPPSVTSIGGRHLPPPSPSVTSLPNFGYQYQNGQYLNGHRGRGSRNGGYGGFGYAIPYYYPADNSAYGYDYVGDGGPDLYSGPPLGMNDQTLHIVVEQPPARPYTEPPPEDRSYAMGGQPQPVPAATPALDIKPGELTVLVFRNGKQQEVTNYAIMGDTLYVFDEGRKKIALTDLDIPATVKANDDRGLEFKVPATLARPKNSSIELTVPDANPTAPSSVASAMR